MWTGALVSEMKETKNMADQSVSWLLQPDKVAPTPRVPGDTEYHRVYAGEKRQVLRGVVTIILLFAGLIVFAQLSLAGASAIDTRVFGRTGFTPLQFAAGTFSLALLIPYSMLLQRWLYGVPAGSLHSVSGKFRFGLFGRSLLVFGPFIMVAMSIGVFFKPDPAIPWSTADLVLFLIVGMTLVPLAAAGEEYGLRGLMFRVVGSWTRGSLSGAVLGIAFTTVLFSLFHGSLDPYILGSYLVLFATMAIITWRTGGLEIAIVLHAVYNASAFMFAIVLHVDVGGALDSRDEISGNVFNLVPSAVLVAITALIWWSTHMAGPVRTPKTPMERSHG